MFSSNTDLWSTPQELFDDLDRVYRFDVDVCATPENAKCSTFYTKEQDGLAQEWRGTCWMNPPYGREICRWVAKARRSAEENGATVVCLLPARTDTRWWHEHCSLGHITFIKGRLKFGGSKNGAPFPSAIVVFGAKDER
jgi:phage N-6-adenine-methyltransferase